MNPMNFRALAVRIERERNGEGWLAITHNREWGWLHSSFNAALSDAHIVAASYDVAVRSSAGVAS